MDSQFKTYDNLRVQQTADNAKFKSDLTNHVYEGLRSLTTDQNTKLRQSNDSPIAVQQGNDTNKSWRAFEPIQLEFTNLFKTDDKPGAPPEAPTESPNKGLFGSKTISDDLINDLVKVKGKKPEDWRQTLKEVQNEIEKDAKDPDAAMLGLVEKNRVVIFGEYHTNGDNPARDWMAKHMADLKKKGVTHIALEVDSKYQAVFDDFLKTGKLDYEKHKLDPLKFPDNYMAVLEAARKEGLKLICADDPYWENKDKKAKKVGRDGYMADEIKDVLKADKEAKVVLLVGKGHAGNTIYCRTDDSGPKSIATVLREAGYKTATVAAVVPEAKNTLTDFVKDLKKPIAVETGSTKELKKLRQIRVRDPFEEQEEEHREINWGEHDLLIFFPAKKK